MVNSHPLYIKVHFLCSYRSMNTPGQNEPRFRTVRATVPEFQSYHSGQ